MQGRIPRIHEERQRTMNESAAKMKSRVIYRVCVSMYVAISVVRVMYCICVSICVAISVVRFNNEAAWAKDFAQFIAYVAPPPL